MATARSLFSALLVLVLLVLRGVPSSAAASAPAMTWKRQPCGAHVAGNAADIVTRWGAAIDPSMGPVLPEYPRPQLRRGGAHSSWQNLNGMWQWEPTTGVNGTATVPPPFGRTLGRSILVPFPSESCLSGIRENHPYQYYRLVFDAATSPSKSALHFGAVDWKSKVWLNGKLLGEHVGGYDEFSWVLPTGLKPAANELIVFVYDPSELGAQPFGKQRAVRVRMRVRVRVYAGVANHLCCSFHGCMTDRGALPCVRACVDAGVDRSTWHGRGKVYAHIGHLANCLAGVPAAGRSHLGASCRDESDRRHRHRYSRPRRRAACSAEDRRRFCARSHHRVRHGIVWRRRR
jgi:hypothetical protein